MKTRGLGKYPSFIFFIRVNYCAQFLLKEITYSCSIFFSFIAIAASRYSL